MISHRPLAFTSVRVARREIHNVPVSSENSQAAPGNDTPETGETTGTAERAKKSGEYCRTGTASGVSEDAGTEDVMDISREAALVAEGHTKPGTVKKSMPASQQKPAATEEEMYDVRPEREDEAAPTPESNAGAFSGRVYGNEDAVSSTTSGVNELSGPTESTTGDEIATIEAKFNHPLPPPHLPYLNILMTSTLSRPLSNRSFSSVSTDAFNSTLSQYYHKSNDMLADLRIDGTISDPPTTVDSFTEQLGILERCNRELDRALDARAFMSLQSIAFGVGDELRREERRRRRRIESWVIIAVVLISAVCAWRVAGTTRIYEMFRKEGFGGIDVFSEGGAVVRGCTGMRYGFSYWLAMYGKEVSKKRRQGAATVSVGGKVNLANDVYDESHVLNTIHNQSTTSTTASFSHLIDPHLLGYDLVCEAVEADIWNNYVSKFNEGRLSVPSEGILSRRKIRDDLPFPMTMHTQIKKVDVWAGKFERYYKNDKNNTFGGLTSEGVSTEYDRLGCSPVNLIVREVVKDSLKSKGGEGLRVLDAGSGLGGTLYCLGAVFDTRIGNKSGKNFYRGITLSPAELKLSKSHAESYNLSSPHATFDQTSFDDPSLNQKKNDVIIAVESLSFSIDLPKTLRNLAQSLKRGGKLVIVDDFTDSDLVMEQGSIRVEDIGRACNELGLIVVQDAVLGDIYEIQSKTKIANSWALLSELWSFHNKIFNQASNFINRVCGVEEMRREGLENAELAIEGFNLGARGADGNLPGGGNIESLKYSLTGHKITKFSDDGGYDKHYISNHKDYKAMVLQKY